MPWDELQIQIGPAVLVWAPIVTALIQILKNVKVGGTPLLGNEKAIWLANLVLGGLGMFLYSILNTNATVLQALVDALMAVVGASGIFEAVKTAGKSQSNGHS